MLTNSDMMYRLLVQGVTDYAIYLLSPEGRVINWNAGAERAKGYRAEEIVGQHFSRFYSADDQADGLPMRGLETARRTGRFEADGWRYRKDGSAFWAHVVIDAIYDQGQLIGFAKITRDRTEQRQLELKQRQQERSFRLLVQGVTDYAIYMLDTDGRVASWNAGAQRAKGYSEQEIVGQHFSRFYSPQDRMIGLPMQGLETARRTGRFEAEGWRYRKDGSAFWAHVVIDAIHDEQGELVGFAKITRDVSERRERERQLLAAKELAERYSEKMTSLSSFLNTVITHIPSAVLVQDAVSRQIMLLNDRVQSFFGIDRHGGIGHTPRECMPAELAQYVETLADAAVRGGTLHRAEDTLATPRGQRTFRSSSTVIRGQDQRQSYVMTIADDVTDELLANAQIQHMAHHDALTGQPNRLLFRQRLNQALATDLAAGRTTAVLCLDLDHFKNVNDVLGHQFGDELLRALTGRLRHVLGSGDTLARLGGDEFAIILPQISDAGRVQELAQQMIDAVCRPFLIDGHSLNVGISIGIALSPSDHHSADQLLRFADMALYEAKRNGRNRAEHFRADMEEAAHKRRAIETDLREAIRHGQLQLFYQPITDRGQSHIVGYEALMRWRHPRHGMMLPQEFIPVAEETGLIHELGALALHEACREAAQWPASQTVAVNLSPVQFKNADFVASIQSALSASALEPSRLELEITESVLLDNTEANIETLQRIKALGVRIALDDFGTGYSSLSYLRSFPFDKIKIDKSFVRDMHHSHEAMAIIRAVIGMGRSLQVQTTAEGVETSEQLADLESEGCNLFQGYLFGRPQPAQARRTTIGEATPLPQLLG